MILSFFPPITMRYVDGFVIAVPQKNLASYRKMATFGRKLWLKYGALDYKECVADDMHPRGIELTFPKLIKAKPHEIIVFSFIVYKSRTHRDMVNKKVMADPAMSPEKMKEMPMPFAMNRMACGGFKVFVDV